MWWWCGLALAGKWEGVNADVNASKVIAAEATVVHAAVADLRSYSEIWPADCVARWEFVDRTSGIDARAKVKYHIGWMRRSLVVRLSKDEPGVMLELDHEGDRGFFTQIRYGDAPPGSSLVSLSTYLQPPPKLFRSYYFERMKPMWEDCQNRALDALALRVAP